MYPETEQRELQENKDYLELSKEDPDEYPPELAENDYLFHDFRQSWMAVFGERGALVPSLHGK